MNSHFYRQPVILFGIAVPFIMAAVVVGGSLLATKRMTQSFENKRQTFKTYEQGRQASKKIEDVVAAERPHLDRWMQQLSQETASTVATHLRDIMDHLPSKEIQQTAFERPTGVGGFGSVSAQKSSQLRIAFRGTFRTLQRAILELETRMPQLQLQDMKLDPVSGESTLVNMQVTYTAWEN